MNTLKGIGFILLIIGICHVLLMVMGALVISGLIIPILVTLAVVWYVAWCNQTN
jgi:hypothetical protein